MIIVIIKERKKKEKKKRQSICKKKRRPKRQLIIYTLIFMCRKEIKKRAVFYCIFFYVITYSVFLKGTIVSNLCGGENLGFRNFKYYYYFNLLHVYRYISYFSTKKQILINIILKKTHDYLLLFIIDT